MDGIDVVRRRLDTWSCVKFILGGSEKKKEHVLNGILECVASKDTVDGFTKRLVASKVHKFVKGWQHKNICDAINSSDADDIYDKDLLETLSDLGAQQMVTKPSAIRTLVLELALVQQKAFISGIWRKVAKEHGLKP